MTYGALMKLSGREFPGSKKDSAECPKLTRPLLTRFSVHFGTRSTNSLARWYSRFMPGSENSTKRFYYAYLLQSIQNRNLYIGYTNDLIKRLREHNQGLNFSTRPFRPWEVIHYEAYRSEKDAKRREKYLKTSQGTRLLKRMLKEYFYSRNR